MSWDESYLDHVRRLEEGLGPHAFKSSQAEAFLDGQDVVRYYEDLWARPDGRARLENRTPLMIERDRIVYSDEFRRMTDRYHILFQGSQRIFRNYLTQTLRGAQVARSIAGALGLNVDFTEAMALGGKVGAVPFVHVSKRAAANWAEETIRQIDAAQDKRSAKAALRLPVQPELLQPANMPVPTWLHDIASSDVRERASVRIPWAAGDPEEPLYSSGKQSFWMLSTDPFLRVPRKRTFLPQTLYGIWRHSRGDAPVRGKFEHRSPLWQANGYTGISLSHSTHEAQVIRYADDIAWIVENLNDANTAASLAAGKDVRREGEIFGGLTKYLSRRDAPESLRVAIAEGDSGGIYTFFINDLVRTSAANLAEWSSKQPVEVSISNDVPVRLSSAADAMLDEMVSYLEQYVFKELRVENRNVMLEAITRASLEVLYKGDRDHLPQFLGRRQHLEGWDPGEYEQALSLLEDPVHRVQLAVDILAFMSDQEVYDFTGLESI